MSSFNITDVTIAGAYVNAITAAQDSARRNARHHTELRQGPGLLSRLARRIARAVSERRPATLRLATRRV